MSIQVFDTIMYYKIRLALQKCLWGIIAIQAILLCAWIGLYPDTRIDNFPSVHKAINLMQDERPTQPELKMALSAIHSATDKLELLNVFVFVASVSALTVAFFMLIQVRKIRADQSK